MKQNLNQNQIPQITNQPAPTTQQAQNFQNINSYPIQNQQHVLDEDLNNRANQNNQSQMSQQKQIPMNQVPMGQMPMAQMVYPNGMIQQPMMVMPVMMPGYGMMGLPNCVKCRGSGVKPNGGRCPCIGGKSDSEELEDGLAMGIAFSRLGFGYRYPYYGYRGYYW